MLHNEGVRLILQMYPFFTPHHLYRTTKRTIYNLGQHLEEETKENQRGHEEGQQRPDVKGAARKTLHNRK